MNHNGEACRSLRHGVKVTVLTILLASACVAAAACGTAPATATTGTTDAATTTGVTTGSQGTSVTDITMPQPGSPGIPIYAALGWDNVYVVYHLQIQDGWAYIHAIPFTSTDGPTIDTRALLRQGSGGEWQVVEKSANEGLLTDVGAVAEDEEIPLQFKSKHPDAPAIIFPEVKPEDRLIMDAARTGLGNQGYRFNVFLLNTAGGWAYTELRALAYQAGHTTESLEKRALLRTIGGTWQVQLMESTDARSQSELVAALKTQFPDVPAGVLP